MRDVLRHLLRRRLLPARKLKRVHIIGCARSGTTMLHYAMASFRNVNLHQVESDLRFTPSITQSLDLCFKPTGSWLITKREYGWFEPQAVKDIIDIVRHENIALINVVRDPRDVLVSRHAGSEENEYYVLPGRWKKSVDAGQQIMGEVRDDVPTLTLRYEDIVVHSTRVEKTLTTTLGLSGNPELGGFGQLEDTIARTGVATTPWMKRALHTVRNFDPDSIGRWRQDERKRRYLRNLMNAQPDLRDAMTEFMRIHGYGNDGFVNLAAPGVREVRKA